MEFFLTLDLNRLNAHDYDYNPIFEWHTMCEWFRFTRKNDLYRRNRTDDVSLDRIDRSGGGEPVSQSSACAPAVDYQHEASQTKMCTPTAGEGRNREKEAFTQIQTYIDQMIRDDANTSTI